MNQAIRTRFAPSPTGYLHVGGARTALFNFLYARAKKGVFLLRIEDTDQARSNEESCQQMIESMKWLGIDWDEGHEKKGDHGPYRQSERLEIYHETIEKLLAEKKAYPCFCTPEELESKKKRREAMGLPPVYDGKCRGMNETAKLQKLEQGEPHTIRFKIPETKEVIVKDVVQGDVHFDTSLIGDFIILKSDRFPSYNFAVVVDDHLMRISHVIRGVGHLSNTPRQILIFEALGWDQPRWVHVSEIVGSDHKKLSKRHGAASVTAFRDIGYPAEAFMNYMSLLGWAPPDGVEYMDLEKIIQQFDVQRCGKSPAMFDVFDMSAADGIDLNEAGADEFQKCLSPKSKLNWISNQTIRDKTEEEYLKEIMPFVEKNTLIPASDIKTERMREILLALRVYLDYYWQIGEHIAGFFMGDENIFTEEAKEWLASTTMKNLASTLLKNLKDKLESMEAFDEVSIKTSIREAGEASGVKGKELFLTIRAAVTGQMHGLELPVYMKLLGKETVLKRLSKQL